MHKVEALRAQYGTADKWGRGHHTDTCGQPDNGVTVEYTIKSGR
jgi:hypothetical protein